MQLIDFDKFHRLIGHGYRGNSGRKLAYFYNGKIWMVKTSNVLNEYIGSQIYKLLHIPVHETILGKCQEQIVVACCDFTDMGTLLEYSQIKNTMDDKFISGSYASSVQGERLNDVIRVIETSDEFIDIRENVKQRFWDMFIVDTFIHNNNRTNGNWGLLISNNKTTLAPVFANGHAFSTNSAISNESFFLDDNDKRINPLVYMFESGNLECEQALLRFIQRIDMNKIERMIENIPEKAYDLPIITPTQKQFYIELLNETLNKIMHC